MAPSNPGMNRPEKPRPGPRFRMRPEDDDELQDWWFASTAIPLLAATIGPLANVMSIAALITSWRARYEDGHEGKDEHAIGFPDPTWCIALNAASLACGFVGNIFLLFNFTRRIRCRFLRFRMHKARGMTTALCRYNCFADDDHSVVFCYWYSKAAHFFNVSFFILQLAMR